MLSNQQFDHVLTIEDLKFSTNPYIQKLAANLFVLIPSAQKSFKSDLGRSVRVEGELTEAEMAEVEAAYSQECVGIFYSSLQTVIYQLCANNKQLCIPVHPGLYEGVLYPKKPATPTQLKASEGVFTITVVAGAKPSIAAVIPGSIELILELTPEKVFKLTQVKTNSLLLKDILMEDKLPDLTHSKYEKDIQIKDVSSVNLLKTLSIKPATSQPEKNKPVIQSKPKSFHQTYKNDIRFGAGIGAIVLGVIGIGVALAAAFIPYAGPELCKQMFNLSIGWIAAGLTSLGIFGGAAVGASIATGVCVVDRATKTKKVVPAQIPASQSHPSQSKNMQSATSPKPSQQGHFARSKSASDLRQVDQATHNPTLRI